MSKQEVFLLVGVPGSGKTWITNQLKDEFHYVSHDLYMRDKKYNYDEFADVINKAARESTKPILTETPFSISKLMEPLDKMGIKVTPVFVDGDVNTVRRRYQTREAKPFSAGNVTRMQTFRQRAREMRAKIGASTEILEWLKQQVK